MSDFILEYDMLESIAKYSKSLGKRSNEYGESLERKIIDAIENVTGTSSSYLTSASDSIRDKVSVLKQKSDAFYHFAEQITDLLEVAEQRDKEVADAIAAQKEYFLDHHESLRIDDWKSNLIELFVDIKNSIPFLDVLVDILDGLDIIFESLKDSIKHWYECEGGKYIVKAIGSVVVAVGAITLFVITLPASGFFSVCGAIGAGIGAVNAVTNVVTTFRAVDAATDGNPAWAVIYGKQDKLSDVLRQTNFGDGLLNDLSNMGARALDKTETLFNYIGIAEIGLGLGKLLGGKAFKFIKNKDSLNFSNLKNSAKNGIVDLKSNIKQGYTNFKTAIKGNTNAKSLLGDMPAEDLARYNKYWDDVAKGDSRYILDFRGGFGTHGQDVPYLSDFFEGVDGGVIRGLDEPTFYSVINPKGGKVFVSTDKITQSNFSNIIDQTEGRVNLITGAHGTIDGTLITERSFLNDDIAKWGSNSNIHIYDINSMTKSKFSELVNDSNTTICAWCYSERSRELLKALGLIY